MNPRTLLVASVLFTSCADGGSEIPTPSPDLRSTSYKPPARPDFTGINCAVVVGDRRDCTDVDTKIPYETGHLGCKFRHDECADREGRNSMLPLGYSHGRGNEPIVGGKRYDYLFKPPTTDVKDVLGEVKTNSFKPTDAQFLVDSTAKTLADEIWIDFYRAQHCGFRMELLIADDRLYPTIVPLLPTDGEFLMRHVQSCR